MTENIPDADVFLIKKAKKLQKSGTDMSKIRSEITAELKTGTNEPVNLELLHWLELEIAKDFSLPRYEKKENKTMFFFRSFGLKKSPVTSIKSGDFKNTFVINKITPEPILLDFNKLETPIDQIGVDKIVIDHYEIVKKLEPEEYDSSLKIPIYESGTKVIEKLNSGYGKYYENSDMFLKCYDKKYSRITSYNRTQEEIIFSNMFSDVKLDISTLMKDSEIDISFMKNMILSRISDFVLARIKKYKIKSFDLDRLIPADDLNDIIIESAILYFNEYKKNIFIHNGFNPGEYMVDYLAELTGLCASITRNINNTEHKKSTFDNPAELSMEFDNFADSVLNDIFKTNKNMMQILLLKDQLLR